MRTPFALPLLALLALVPLADARQSYVLTIDPTTSTGSLASDFSVALPGTAIGDYDAVDNPGGTQTRPGFSGGSGNMPVDMDFELGGDTDYSGPPTGSLVLDVDPTVLSVGVRELTLDLLGGGSVRTALSLTLEFDTFRTFNPNSLFVGGIPITLPLGAQTISNLLLVQNGPAEAGVLLPELEPGRYSFAVLIPVELSFEAEFSGQLFPVGPLPLALPLAGELEIGGSSATIRAAFDFAVAQQIPDPAPGFTIDDIPQPVPTILPPGFTANLLLSVAIASVDITAAADFSLEASGDAPCGFETYCTSNPNSSGLPGTLVATGSPDVADGELLFEASGLPAGKFGFLVASRGEALLGTYRGHQGILCLSQPFWRIGSPLIQIGPDGSASRALDFGNLAGEVAIQPGDTWRYQLWFRDQNPNLTWNSTNAVRARFCPAP